MKTRFYLCIDLKSFYASVECVKRGLNPMTARLVVADPERTEKTICLAVSPALKALGIKNRCRVFEIPKSIDYIMAPPRMQLYIDYAAKVYGVYLNYISAEDIHVYSVDEAFLDITDYLTLYQCSPWELAKCILKDIRENLGLYAACGIGTNLYLSKIALDITAKYSADFIGYLDETSYCDTLWHHTPLTDFWRVGRGTADRLARYGLYTMGDIAHADEDFLYRLFGVDAELLIDHAWGKESATIADIKAYKPQSNCLSSGQVLMRDYSFEEGKIIVKEMMDLLCLDLTEKKMVTRSLSLFVGYSNALHIKGASGTVSLDEETNSAMQLLPAVTSLYHRITDPLLPIRRFYLSCNHITPEGPRQYSLFGDANEAEKSRKMQQAVLTIRKKYGKNAVLKGMDLVDCATTKARNCQIGGHKSGISQKGDTDHAIETQI